MGYEIIVTLKSPPDSRVQGVISAVVGQRLTLQNGLCLEVEDCMAYTNVTRLVMLLWNGQRIPEYHIESPGISDLKLTGERASAAQAGYDGSGAGNIGSDVNLAPSQQATVAPATVPSQQDTQPQPFLDPAILSFSRPPKPPPEVQSNGSATTRNIIDSPVMIGESEVPESSREKRPVPGMSTPKPESTTAAAATLSAPFSDLELNPGDRFTEKKGNEPQEGDIPTGRQNAGPLDAPLKYTGKRSRRAGRNKAQKEAALQATGVPEETGHLLSSGGPKKKGFAGNGWRGSPFMESVDPADATPSPSAKKWRGRLSKGRARNNAEESGWATEDATDIQEMGEFDFQSNLSKFDKRRVFDEIRNDDTKSGKDRLVGINRLARPGTSGGRNLHPTENVLDPSPPDNNLDYVSESGETEPDGASGFQAGGGRASSRAGSSKTSVQASRSRKSSGVLAASATSSQFAHINRGPLSSSRTSSPRPHKRPATPSASPLTRSSESPNGSFHITSTNRKCPVVSPLQMLEIEQLAISELGLTDDIITENAGRGIAEAGVSLASDLPASSQILVFAGNHQTGSRAVSAARHFRNRGHRVTLCILGFDRESEFTDAFRKQIDILKKAGGRVMRWEAISPRLSTVDNTPGLVVDALFGVHMTFEELRSDDQATAFEMISWTNRSGTDILSVDIPFGLSSTTGAYLRDNILA